jgi:SAM-dependent methyltransferase
LAAAGVRTAANLWKGIVEEQSKKSDYAFWKDHYARVSFGEGGEPITWLDYSNERVQAQTFGLAIEAAGPLSGRRCLDAGCGWGQLALTAWALGANVVAVDGSDRVMNRLRRRYPRIRWVAGDFRDPSVIPRHENRFDVILAVEVLQYAPIRESLELLWNRLSPGGRIVGVIPNARCPLVAKTVQRFDGRYQAVTGDILARVFGELPGVDGLQMRGLNFRPDQTLWPYQASSWTRSERSSANRLQFVALKERMKGQP